jgi:hypothetical protein
MIECSMENSGACSPKDMECCPPICNPAQCCYCCFLCTVDQEKPEIKIYQTKPDKNRSEEQFALSDYQSDRWQPPKAGTFSR